MAAKPLSDAVLAETVAAIVACHGNIVQAGKSLGVHRATFKSRARIAADRGLVDVDALRAARPKPERVVVVQPSPHLPVTADECWEVLDGWIGRKRIPKVKPPKWQANCVLRAADPDAAFQDLARQYLRNFGQNKRRLSVTKLGVAFGVDRPVLKRYLLAHNLCEPQD